VFWVHASNSTRFKQTYSDIANRVELPGRDDPKADILRLVFNWLCDEGNGRWLMILDNADNADVFFSRDISGIREASTFSSSEAPLASFLPQSSNGTVLITSRNSSVAAQLLDSVNFIIKVEPMEETEALALVRTRLTISESMEPGATALVKALDGIPLAITQACAYIRTNATRFTVSSYLELFLESEMNQAHLLQSADIGDVRRDPSVSNAVLTTWQISFKQIRESTPAAAELLSFMCVLDRQGIPEFLLHDGTNRLDFENRLRPLIDFSLVSTQLDNHTFEMHRLVQLATKRWLASHSELAGWERKALQEMARVYPFGEHKNWGICGELLPHSKAILAYMVESKGDILNQASLLHNTAEYLYTRGEYATAEEMNRRALEGKEKVLGKEHLSTLASMNNLAEVLRDQGKYEQAEEIHRRTLKGKEKMLGKEHLSTLASMNNLALVLRGLGEYDKGEEMHRRTLKRMEKVLGKEHPDTLVSINNLASVLNSQGKYDEAEEMHRRTLEGTEKVLGKEHLSTLASMNNLAEILRDQGKYEQAEEIHRRTLERREKVLGKEHPDTLASMNNLALVLNSQRKDDEAEKIHRRTLEKKEKILGKEHPGTLASMNNLALVLDSQGKYDKAEELHRQTLEGREKILGKEHPGTLASMNNLALVLDNQRKYDEAEKIHRRTLEKKEKILGKEHPNTLGSMNNLAEVLQRQGKYEQAEKIHRRALEGREKTLGKEHPDTLTSVYCLAYLYHQRNRYDTALELYQRACDAYKRTLGPQHPTTVECCNNFSRMVSEMDQSTG
jgi:tetratricopeptide (TPR) repeat protein